MSSYKDLFKHSFNYLLANIATKALAFISIPVYTRLLTVEEYGIVSVFLATIGISSVLFTLNLEVAVSRYYYETDDIEDFKSFVGTTVTLTFLAFFCTTCIYVLKLDFFSKLLSFNKYLTLSIIPVSLYTIVNSIFQQIYGPLLESKKIAIVSSIQTYLAFILSIIIILILPKDRYFGQVLGTILSMVILSIYLYKQIKPYCRLSLKKTHILYVLSYALPNIPYALSGVIIAQFGRLILSNYSGFSSAGLYSFSASIGAIMMILISVTHQAWNPYYFKYMNNRDYTNIDNDYNLIWRITLVIAFFLSLFGYEIGIVLADSEYWASLQLVPFFVLGYVFYQWAYVYLRNTGYAKKLIWNALAVLVSGCTNVVLSIYSVKFFGNYGVAAAFAISYFILLLVSYLINKYILCVHAPSITSFFKPFMLFIIIWCISIYLYYVDIPYIIKLMIKVVLLLLVTLLYLKQYIPQLTHYFQYKFKK